MPSAPKNLTGGDDLDDGLDLNADYLAFSAADVEPASDDDGDDEEPARGDQVRRNGNARLSDEDDFDIRSDAEGSDDVAVGPSMKGLNGDRAAMMSGMAGKKRKAPEATDDAVADEAASGSKSLDDEQKKKKLKSKDAERKQKRNDKAGPPPGQMTVEELDAYYFANLRKAFSRASDMELADLRLPTGSIMSTSTWTEERDLSTMVEFIKTVLPRLPKNLKKEGTPSIIILSLSGMRCADVVRTLKTMDPKPPGEVAKLFAKHFKLSEQIEHLQKTKIGIAVGTPGRIAKILKESDALRIRQQTIILLDLSFHDPKERTLLTINEIRDEFWKGIFGDPVVRAKVLGPDGVKFAVF